MEKRYDDFRDIFQVIRYGFSGRKIAVHLIGLVLAYLIYETLVYLSLMSVGGTAAQDFWRRYGLLPILPFSDAGLTQRTVIAMWVGIVVFAGIFFLASTVVSKITIAQLRGDFFYSVGDALTFLRRHWISVLGAFLSLLLIQIFLTAIPLGIAGIGKLPAVGKPFLMLTSLLLPIGFFFGLLMLWMVIVFGVSLLFVPAVAATTGADTFEIVYQQFAIAWNKPWVLVCYEGMLFLIKLIFVPIWAVFCLASFSVVMLPMRLLHAEAMRDFMHYANLWLGGAVEKFAALIPVNNFGGFGTSTHIPTLTGVATVTTPVTAIFLTLTFLMGVGLVVAYLFSIASVGNTVIYTIVRQRIDGQNLLEPTATEPLQDLN